jgi:hypothetical protein
VDGWRAEWLHERRTGVGGKEGGITGRRRGKER